MREFVLSCKSSICVFIPTPDLIMSIDSNLMPQMAGVDSELWNTYNNCVLVPHKMQSQVTIYTVHVQTHKFCFRGSTPEKIVDRQQFTRHPISQRLNGARKGFIGASLVAASSRGTHLVMICCKNILFRVKQGARIMRTREKHMCFLII